MIPVERQPWEARPTVGIDESIVTREQSSECLAVPIDIASGCCRLADFQFGRNVDHPLQFGQAPQVPFEQTSGSKQFDGEAVRLLLLTAVTVLPVRHCHVGFGASESAGFSRPVPGTEKVPQFMSDRVPPPEAIGGGVDEDHARATLGIGLQITLEVA